MRLCFVGWGAWVCWRLGGGMEHLLAFGAALIGSAVGMLMVSSLHSLNLVHIV